MKQTFILITRSYKYGGYCVAGIDPETKRWVRLVSKTSPAENEIPKHVFEPFDDLDILEVETRGAVPYGCQTENVLLDLNVRPVRRGRLSFYELLSPDYCDRSPTIFGNTLSALNEAEIGGQSTSLGLFFVDTLRFDYAFRDDGKWHFRCSFRYMGTTYSDVSVTDPIYRRERFAGETVAHALIVLSLPCLPYSEKYYKFVAKIFPLNGEEAKRAGSALAVARSAAEERPPAASFEQARRERAEKFLLSLADGRDPDTGETLDPVCVFSPAYAAQLRDCAALIAAMRPVARHRKKKEEKKTYLLKERISEIAVSEEAVTASVLKDRVNLVREPYSKPLSAHAVVEFFVAVGMIAADEAQSSQKYPTERGKQYGVRAEARSSERGFHYFAVVYGRRAQQFFLDNIEQCVEVIQTPAAGQGKKAPTAKPPWHVRAWKPEEDAMLIREFAARLTLEEIARRHKRPLHEIAERLQKLGVEVDR